MNMIRHLFKAAFLGAALVILGNPFSSRAATVTVQVGSGGNFFAPVTTNILVNDQVLWSWVGSFHNVTSTNNAWTASATLNAGATFSHTFTTPGTYFYFCSIHGTPTTGMTGAIIVNPATVPPTVTITNPAPGRVFAAPANVTLQASASSAVTNVQFLIDSAVLSNDNTAPYSAVANNLAAGSHILSAIAMDNNGATATNQVTISVVAPVAVLLSAPQPVPPGKFRFSYTANAGLNYIVQSSSNLASSSWTTLITNMAAGSSINFTDQNATLDSGFYRVGLLPNP